MMDVGTIPVQELLPHGPEMILIDRLISSEPSRSVALVDVGPASMFAYGTGVPVWVGIEYMAQTIAARVGFEARRHGEAPPVGFLLGTRSFRCSVTQFDFGTRLRVVVEPLFIESGLGAFDCCIEAGGELVAAVVNTYQPDAATLAVLRTGGGRP
jgi:predicted hotdog family 3-hydroxylacyl-ACP dehydratase